ncbi:HutD family protein [Marinomonas foliarum]|uniref:HutD family protein n=1 Tax=Marinomonas foliarum TaxID=491950 RepID=A0ABX7INN5_9GAMM|nr:HutD family protein [Marinomonas foliarum]QRV22859.1 HutD family protein [Marinomonas foliarum]
MPSVIIIEQAEYQRMPWKNGLGETLEIQRYEDNDGLRFRISQASVVENGVFSDFSGLHRTLVLLSGEGMALEHTNSSDNHLNILSKPLDIARFSGGDETLATLKNGKIEDLNIMVRDTDTQAKVQACTALCFLSFSNNTLFNGFYVCEDSVLEIENADAMSVKAHSMVIGSENINATLRKGSGVFIKITKLD